METFFISKLKPFLDAVAEEMEVYVPKKSGEHYVFSKYDSSSTSDVEFNTIRACTPVKEFLFPILELAAEYGGGSETKEEIKPFAVFGLKDCDVRSINILDKVFKEEGFEDSLYLSRRDKMFVISSDCYQPGDSCFCSLFEGQGFSREGFDMNIAKIKDGFIVETGSQKGRDFIGRHSELFADVPETLLNERDNNRAEAEKLLEQKVADFELTAPIREIVENNQDSDIFDEQARGCIECQACTRVCPTCHCFYLYDSKKKDYFVKMKMWDSCMRFSYAAVAGGENPNKVLGDRMKHRLMHKFVHFLDRYGVNMCVGCGRCVDADAGGMDLREVLKKLSRVVRR